MRTVVLIVAALLMSWSLAFAQENSGLKKAYFAGGCFWGVEYHLEKLPGVKSVVSGFMGGHVKNPSYKEVVYTRTGHVETVEVVYDPKKISYETVAKNFFEIHDFTQTDGQGPDIGTQYLSVAFYSDAKERAVVEKLVSVLTKKGYKVATTVKKADTFYAADGYHQDYYRRSGKLPYCHSYQKVFD
ncbi:MAG: peptide-methionine (S)-S-oxide reductase MsrA [Campylobacterota bacterium]